MKLGYELSELALEDLNSIWDYTAKKWSTVQANKYFKEIISQFNSLCKNPEIGRILIDVKPTHRISIIKSHLIIYKIEHQRIFIDRILQQSMDIESIL